MSAAVENQRRILIGMVVSVLLGLVKLVAGVAGHSYALVADAVESLVDIVSGAVVLGGLRIAAKPASERHPYGYGRAEALAAVIVALLIFAAGLGIAVEAVREILTPHHAPAPYTLAVLVVVVLVKESLFRALSSAAAETESSAVGAEAFHHRSDAITSALAFVGISVALIGGAGWEPADDWAALTAAGVIVFNAYKLIVLPVRELLDMQSAELRVRAETIAAEIPGVRRVQKVYTRKSGPIYWIDMHIWVDPEMNVREAHALGHRVKDAIRHDQGSVQDVLIHLEPDNSSLAPDQDK